MRPTATDPAAGPAIERIAIAGNGLEAWLVANHLLAGFGSRKVKVTVCPVKGSDALDALYSVFPAGPDDGLSNIGLTSPVLVNAAEASFSLGTSFEGQFKPYGSLGLDFVGLPFHHHILRANSDLNPRNYFEWSPATWAMQQNTFAPPVTRTAIGVLQHGMAYHLDVSRLTGLLRSRVSSHGVKATRGSFESIRRCETTGRIEQLNSDRGEIIKADLYLDCSGPQRTLTRDHESHSWVAASGLPEYTIRVERESNASSPPPYHRVARVNDGWRLEIPGQGWVNRIELSTASDSGSGMKFSPGHLSNPWLGNCLAMGGAAATLLPTEPLHARYLALSLARCQNLMPGSDCDARETAEYNHLAHTELEDLQALTTLYELARRKGGLGSEPVVSELAGEILGRRIALFAKRGRVTPSDAELLKPSDWVAAFILLGQTPERYDPLADRLPMESLRANLEKLKTKILNVASGFPPHGQYLDAVKSAAGASVSKSKKSHEGQHER